MNTSKVSFKLVGVKSESSNDSNDSFSHRMGHSRIYTLRSLAHSRHFEMRKPATFILRLFRVLRDRSVILYQNAVASLRLNFTTSSTANLGISRSVNL